MSITDRDVHEALCELGQYSDSTTASDLHEYSGFPFPALNRALARLQRDGVIRRDLSAPGEAWMLTTRGALGPLPEGCPKPGTPSARALVGLLVTEEHFDGAAVSAQDLSEQGYSCGGRALGSLVRSGYARSYEPTADKFRTYTLTATGQVYAERLVGQQR